MQTNRTRQRRQSRWKRIHNATEFCMRACASDHGRHSLCGMHSVGEHGFFEIGYYWLFAVSSSRSNAIKMIHRFCAMFVRLRIFSARCVSDGVERTRWPNQTDCVFPENNELLT